MRETYCDTCGNIIKETEPRHLILETTELTEEEINDVISDSSQQLKKYIQNPEKDVTLTHWEKKELCTKCKEVHDFIMNLRYEEMRGLHANFKEIEEAYYNLTAKGEGNGKDD